MYWYKHIVFPQTLQIVVVVIHSLRHPSPEIYAIDLNLHAWLAGTSNVDVGEEKKKGSTVTSDRIPITSLDQALVVVYKHFGFGHNAPLYAEQELQLKQS